MIRCNNRSCDRFSIIELFIEIEAHLECQSSCIDPEEIYYSFRVFEVLLQRANETVGGKEGEHSSCVQGKTEETAFNDFLLVPLAEILADRRVHVRRHLYSRVILVFLKGFLCEAIDKERQQQPVYCDYGDNDANHQLNY